MSGSLNKDGGGADRVILAALLSALSILGAGWFLMRESESPSRPLVFPPVSAAGRATYLVSGLAEPSSTVTVRATELAEVATQADGGGHFQVELTLPKAGEYQVAAWAKNARGVAGPPSLPVTFAHGDQPAAPPFSRNVVVTASFRRVSVYVAVTLPSSDARAGELIRGADFGEFLRDVFEDEAEGEEFSASGADLSDFFKGVKPRLSVTPHLTVVRARSERVLPDSGFQQIRNSSVVAAPRWAYVGGARDTFTVVVKDYEVTAVTPVPDWSAGETFTWLIRHERPQPSPPLPSQATPEGGGQGRKAEEGGDERGADEEGDAGSDDGSSEAVKSSPRDVSVRLSYSPFDSPKNFLHLSRLSPFEAVPDRFDLSRFGAGVWELHGGETWINLAYSLLFVIPVAWTLGVLSRSRRSSRALYFLLAAALLSSVLLCANAVSDAIYHNFYDDGAGANPLVEVREEGNAGTPRRQSTDLIFMLPAVALVPVALLIPSALAWLLLPSARGAARRRRRLRGLAAPFVGACLAAAVALALLGLLGLLSVRPFSAVSPALVATTLGTAFFVLLYVVLGAAVAGQGFKDFLRSRPRREWVLVLAASAVLAHPDTLGLLPAPVQQAHVTGLDYLRSFFSIVTTLTSYALLPLLLALLRRRHGGESPPLALNLGFILFAGYVVGSTANWFLIPVPFLLALWVFPRFVLLPPPVRRAVDAAHAHVVAERPAILARVLSAETRASVRDTLKKLREKLAEGEISADEFEQRRAGVEKLLSAGAEGHALPGGLDERRFVLGVGPSPTKWEDGVWAARVGLIIALPFLVINFWELIQTVGQRPHAHFYFIARAVIHVAGWLTAAFFFGYFFSYLRGGTGLKKGVCVSLAVVSCLLPVWLITLPEPPALLLRAGQTFIFFTLLGLCAFDYFSLRGALGERFEWRNLLDAQDAPSLTAFASVLVASSGVVAKSVLTGDFQGVLTQVVEITVQQIPGLLWE